MKNIRLIAGAIIIILLISGIIYLSYNSNKKIIGGDKDSHGCLGGTGDSWCESKQKCLRIWEESCAESFCLYENIDKIYKCGDYVKVISSLLGGGALYYTGNMTEINCPLVGPDSITEECQNLSELNCDEVKCKA